MVATPPALPGGGTGLRAKDGPLSDQFGRTAASRLNVLCLGAPPDAALPAESLADCRVTHAPTLDNALEVLAATGPPELFLVVAERPGEIPEDWFVALRARAPLAGWVGIVGPWCEGEPRSGHPWRSITRWYWSESPARWSRGLAEHRAGRLAPWNLPSTLTEEERLAWPAPPAPPLPGRLAIRSRDPDIAAWLADFVARGPSVAVPWPESAGMPSVDALIWDLTGDGDELPPSCGPSGDGRPSAGGPPLVVLANFPRLCQVAAWHRAGAVAVLTKPVDLADLTWELRRAVHLEPSPPRSAV